jgi:hypothetical protein
MGYRKAGRSAPVADDVRMSASGPNGNGLQLDLQQKKISFTGKDALTLVLIVVLGAGLWLRSQDISADLKAISTHLQALYARQDVLRTELQQQNVAAEVKTQQQNDKVSEQSAELIAEIRAQTKELTANRIRLEDRIERGMEKLWTALTTFNENLRREPATQLPLGVPLPRESAPREAAPGGQR